VASGDRSRSEALAERLKQAGIKGQTGKAVSSRVAALSELVANAGRTGEVADFLAQLQAKESGWGERGFAYLLDHLAQAAADPNLARLHGAAAAIQDARVPLFAAVAHKFLPLVNVRTCRHANARPDCTIFRTC
jgi:hypothetical protein